MNEIKASLAGRFKLVATNSQGKERVLADWFDNLILDAGLNRLGTGGAIDRMSVGSGNSTPTVGQTALDALLGTTTSQSTSPVRGYDSVGNQYVFIRWTYRFAAGVVVGNVAEVGAGWSTGLFSRALIKDSDGSPTTVTVLSDETLDVIYEVRVYLPSDVTDTLTISGVTHNIVLRPEQISNLSSSYWDFNTGFNSGLGSPNSSAGGGQTYGPGALGGILVAPGGAAISGSSAFAGVGSYVNNSNERIYRNTFGLTSGNAPIYNMSFYSRIGAYKASFDPPIAKDNTKVLTIDWKITWARRP